MPPSNDTKGHGRGKRPRDSSREKWKTQEGLSDANYNPSSNVPRPDANPDFRSPPARSGTWEAGDSRTPMSESPFGQPVNVITSHPPPGKVAIRSLQPPKSFKSSVRGSKQGRTSHACDACRKAKAGCTGAQPCARCENAGVSCVYGDGKREHDRKMMKKLENESLLLHHHTTDVTEALQRIQLDTSLSQIELRAAIDHVIAMSLNPVSPPSRGGSLEPSRGPSTWREEREASNEIDDAAEVGSTGSLDVINVDTDRDDTRATGHLGKASAVAWVERTNEEMNKSKFSSTSGQQQQAGHTFSSYHVEDADVEFVDTSTVNPYDWPEYSRADTLVQVYFEHTHLAFPILDRAAFMGKYSTFPRGADNLGASDQIWLGTLNIMFAVSAVFGDLTNCRGEGHVDDHLTYCARAKALCMDDSFLFQDARLSITSFLGMLSLYYVSICRLNRAWVVCGVAIRSAVTLGLHIRSEVEALSEVEKEQRVRIWWSLYSLEILLNELMGRPSCICDRDISTPLPLNIEENDMQSSGPLSERENSAGQSTHTRNFGRRNSKGRSSATYEMPVGYSHPIALSFPNIELPVTSSTYFIYRTQLSIISHEIITQLYCAAAVKEKWSEVQETMKAIDGRLLLWRDSLPKNFDIMFDTWTEPDWNDPTTLPRIALAISFNSCRMILFRPCLCRVDGRLQNHPRASPDFEQEAVEYCIHSARRMISLLKWNAKSPARFYAISSWWNTLHYLCEALSVLMLEMAFEVEHLPNETIDILNDAKEGIFWLAMLSASSIAARKAWEIFDNLIRLVAPKIKWSVFDLPKTAPVPSRYNWRRFGKEHPQVWYPPSSEKLRQHQASQPPVPDLITAWANQGLHQSFPEPTTPEQFSNQLNSTMAIEHFANMGQMYGRYDGSWPELFAPITAPSPIGIGGLLTGPQLAGSQQLGSLPELSGGSRFDATSQGERYLTQASFDRNVGGYETLSPTTVQGFHGFQGDGFEQQQQGQMDMQRRSEQEFAEYEGSGF